jgi:hypothetical protein
MAWRKPQERSKHPCRRPRHARSSRAAKRPSLTRTNELAILVTEHWKRQAVGPLGDVTSGRIPGIAGLSR